MKRSPNRLTRFAVCIDNGDYPASLEPRKLYEVLPDSQAQPHGQLRVIDESGEDYLYPARYFRLVIFPPALDRMLRRRKARLARISRPGLRPAAVRSA
jgi:hypothetical protein